MLVSARPAGQRRRWLAAVLASAAAHAVLLLWASRSHRPAEKVPARLPVSISFLPSPERYLVELAPRPSPAGDKSSSPDRLARQPAPRRLAGPARARTESSPPAPAAAAPSVAPSPDPGAPLDLTGDPLIAGTALAPAGGTTASSGAGTGAGRAPGGGADPRSTAGARRRGPDRSRAISLEDQSWSCPWPRDGDAAQIDEQTVVIRVVVRADGSTESAEVLADPGHGFGPAALACALRTRFTPARGPQGEAVRARSPPIKVRFTR